MVSFRRPAGLHPQAVRTSPTQAWRPGQGGSGMQPIGRTPLSAYRGKVSNVPLSGGSVQGIVPASGVLSLTSGPQGAGTVWYPAQATVSTTTGVLDTSTCSAYLGSQGTPALLVGTVFPGGAGTISLAVPSMSPGQYLIFVWTGAHPGDTAGANVIGTQDALTS